MTPAPIAEIDEDALRVMRLAPELLRELKHAVWELESATADLAKWGYVSPTVNAARALIAKAEGVAS